MISVWLVGIVIKREPDGLSALSLACVLVLLWCPRELGLPGFQLSFLAVLGLILLAGPLTTIVTGWLRGGSRRPRRLRTGPRFLIGACASSVVAWIATTPLQILHFHVVTPVGLLINVVASLWLTATIACGTALLLVPEVAAGAVAWASTWLVRGALAVNGTLARWPLAARYLADVVTLRVVLAYAVLLALALWIRYRVRQRARDAACGVTLAAGGRLAWARPALVTALALLIAVACMSPRVAAPPDPGRVRLSVLDVSHGSSALVETAGGASVFDCGSSRLLPGRRVTAPALWSLGHDRIEWLVLSHADSDHVSGVLDLVDRFPIARGVAIGPAFTEARLGRRIVDGLQSRGVLVREVRAGDRLDLGGGVAARVLAGGERTGTRGASVPARHGRGRTRLSENDRSIVVRLESPGSEDGLALFPGDLEDHGTRRLLLDSPGKHLRAQVLVVPHHGAKNRSSRELARAVRPRLALVSSRPGRSASATVGAFEREGARVLETAYDGALTVELGRRKPLRKGRNRSSR
jgi:competence protein ComEC